MRGGATAVAGTNADGPRILPASPCQLLLHGQTSLPSSTALSITHPASGLSLFHELVAAKGERSSHDVGALAKTTVSIVH